MSEVSEISIGIFDINGTIQDREGVPKQITEAFKEMGRRGLRTTVATGRGVVRAKELLGEALPTVVSPGMPISVENGGRLSTLDGKNLIYHTLSSDVQTSTLDVLSTQKSDVEFAAYYPRDSRRGISLWTPTGNVPASFTKRHGDFGELHTDTVADLGKRMLDDEACMLIVKPRDIALATAFAGANVEINEGELNILNGGINKGRGVLDIAEFTGTPLNQVMVAGNDHNDVSMLELSVGRKLFVGDNEVNLVDERIIQLATPYLLGRYLKKLAISDSMAA
jgi:hydroxymethylpyrimidine pyrophosphatase-like HAD family hydrolase